MVTSTRRDKWTEMLMSKCIYFKKNDYSPFTSYKYSSDQPCRSQEQVTDNDLQQFYSRTILSFEKKEQLFVKNLLSCEVYKLLNCELNWYKTMPNKCKTMNKMQS